MPSRLYEDVARAGLRGGRLRLCSDGARAACEKGDARENRRNRVSSRSHGKTPCEVQCASRAVTATPCGRLRKKTSTSAATKSTAAFANPSLNERMFA